MNKKWSDAESRWLKANLERMDVQSLSHELGFPLAEVEKRIKQLKVAAEVPPVKKPATLKEAVRELSAARKDYERAIELFHKREFDEAAAKFEDLIEKHAEEKEFADRARVYLAACRNGRRNKSAMPSEPDEIYHAAVYEKNCGNVERALELLKRTVPAARPGDGKIHYLAACCHALVGDNEQALSNLRKAIAVDGQSRIQARLENDLASLRGTAAFTELLAGI